MFKKFLSRKLLVFVATAILDVLVASGTITPELKILLLQLITAIGVTYISVEGIRDIVIEIKRELTT